MKTKYDGRYSMKQSQIGQRLQALREKAGLSAREVARRAGIAESTYRDWEYGRAIKGDPYSILAQIFGVTLSELMMGDLGRQNTYILERLNQIERLIAEIKTTI